MPNVFMSIIGPITFVGVVLIVMAAIAIALWRRSTPATRSVSVTATKLMSPRELQFFNTLDKALEGLPVHICPQAAIDEFITFKGEGAFGERSRYKARRSDFAIIGTKADVLLVVEVDDSSHDRKQDQDRARDAMIASAGIPTLRIPKGNLPTTAALGTLLAPHRKRLSGR